MERDDVPDSWIGLIVRATVKTPRGGQYLVLAELLGVDEEGIRLSGDRTSAAKTGGPLAARAYPWDSLVDVQPSEAP